MQRRTSEATERLARGAAIDMGTSLVNGARDNTCVCDVYPCTSRGTLCVDTHTRNFVVATPGTPSLLVGRGHGTW